MKLILFALTGILVLSLGAANAAIYVSVAPPPARIELRAAAPCAGAVWVDGHWSWSGRKHVWVPGYWERNPEGTWVAGYWEERPDGWVWIDGYWDRPGVVATKAPPALKTEVRPPRPSKSAVWISGHWKWSGTRYVWVSGYWNQKPKGTWVPGHWAKRRSGHVWIKGHWRR